MSWRRVSLGLFVLAASHAQASSASASSSSSWEPAPTAPPAASPAHTASRRPLLSDVRPADLFPSVDRTGPAMPGDIFKDSGARPRPTNAWWENMAVDADRSGQLGNVFQMPYVVTAGNDRVRTSWPVLQTPGQNDEFEQRFPSTEAVTLGTVESIVGPHALEWDELTVSIQYKGTTSHSLAMLFPLARGSPYITAEYHGFTPKVAADDQYLHHSLSPVISVDGVEQPCDSISHHSGRVISFHLEPSDAVWFLFSPPSVRWVCSADSFSLTAQTPLRGVLRLALGMSCASESHNDRCHGKPWPPDGSDYGELLQQHAGSFPRRSSCDFEVQGDLAHVKWQWEVRTLENWTESPLLQLAWPVHAPLLCEPDLRPSAVTPFHDVRGIPVAVVGNVWELEYKLFPDVGFKAPRAVAPAMREEIRRALSGEDGGALWDGAKGDKDFDLPSFYQQGLGDTYFSGKLLARLARLVAIADEVGDSEEDYFEELLSRLQERLEVWFRPDTGNPLVYDRSWGGLLSCGCKIDDCDGTCESHCEKEFTTPEECPALTDAQLNFGSGFYNDHHFHYGYFVYAIAVLTNFRPRWEAEWREKILAMVRDYGNPSPADLDFPVARHKDWFLGLSWASGIWAFYNGRNQESTSEAINAYYSLYLYGSSVQAPFSSGLKDFARLMTAMEIHACDTYWHVRADSEIYPRTYTHPVVGILWDHAAEFHLWFGKEPYVVSGIHMIPVTPVMEAFLKPDWVQEHRPGFMASCRSHSACESTGWSWSACLEAAVVDDVQGYRCVHALPANAFSVKNKASNGNSLSNSLHWLATRPGAQESLLPRLQADDADVPRLKPPEPPQPPAELPSAEPADRYRQTCEVGHVVRCPDNNNFCAGDQCCPDGTTCPSASPKYKDCVRPKVEDCTGSWLEGRRKRSKLLGLSEVPRRRQDRHRSTRKKSRQLRRALRSRQGVPSRPVSSSSFSSPAELRHLDDEIGRDLAGAPAPVSGPGPRRAPGPAASVAALPSLAMAFRVHLSTVAQSGAAAWAAAGLVLSLPALLLLSKFQPRLSGDERRVPELYESVAYGEGGGGSATATGLAQQF